MCHVICWLRNGSYAKTYLFMYIYRLCLIYMSGHLPGLLPLPGCKVTTPWLMSLTFFVLGEQKLLHLRLFQIAFTYLSMIQT